MSKFITNQTKNLSEFLSSSIFNDECEDASIIYQQLPTFDVVYVITETENVYAIICKIPEMRGERGDVRWVAKIEFLESYRYVGNYELVIWDRSNPSYFANSDAFRIIGKDFELFQITKKEFESSINLVSESIKFWKTE